MTIFHIFAVVEFHLQINMSIKHTLSYILILIFMALSSFDVVAQCVQKGIVLEYNGKDQKSPIANVEIVVNNASSTVSNKNGEFTLNFRTLKPGDKVSIRRIEKIGYEVFNKDAVEQWYISKSSEPFVIIMCRSDRFKKIRDNYTSVAKSNYTIKFENEQILLKKDLDKGKMPEDEYKSKIQALKDQYETQLESIDSYIDKFARIDLSELNAFEKEVIDLVSKGEIEQAIAKYEGEDLLTKYMSQIESYNKLDEAQQKIAKALDNSLSRRDSIHKVITHQVALLRMAGGKENFDKAMNLMRDVALSDTTNFVAVYDYASYCQKVGRLDEALKFFNTILNTGVPNSHESVQARIGVSNILLKQKEYFQITQSTRPVIEIIEQLAKKEGNPNLYIDERINAKKTLARACAQLKDTTEAIRYYNEAIEDAKILAEMDPSQIGTLVDVEAMACQMYSRSFNMGDEAMAIGKMALEHAKVFYEQNPDLNRARYAFVVNVVASAYQTKKDYNNAERLFVEAEKLYEEAYKKNPEAYGSYLASNKQNLANLYLLKDKNGAVLNIDKALKPLQEADQLINKLIAEGNGNVISYLMYVHLNYSNYYLNTKMYDKAMEYALLSLGEIEPYFKKYPATYLSLYCTGLEYKLYCLEAEGKYKEAIDTIDQLIEFSKSEKYITLKKEYLNKYKKYL